MTKPRLLTVAATAVAVMLPLVVKSDLTLTILVFSFLLAMLAVSFNLIFGFTGQLSMFHAAAYGIGAYATHVGMRDLGLGFWPAVAFAMALVTVLSAIIGTICFRFRLKAFYFAVVTLAFAEMARLVAANWHGVTNGTLRLTLTAKPSIGWPGHAIAIDNTLAWYYLSLTALALTIVVCSRCVHSWMGRCFVAIRLNDALGDALGIDIFRYKLLSFCIANAIAAIAGALYAHFLGYVDPSFLSVDQSLAIVAMVLLGGKGRVAAPVVGAIFLTLLPHLIHFNAEVRAIIYGSILILVILLLPKGIVGTAADWSRRRHA